MFKILENSASFAKISAEIPDRRYANDEKFYLDVANVIDFLEKQHIDLGPGKWISEPTLQNYCKPVTLVGEWVYEKDSPKITLTREKKPDIVSSNSKIETTTKKRVRRSARKSTNTINAKED